MSDPTQFYYPNFKYFPPNISDAGRIWNGGPTREGIIVYSVIVPIICVFGIIGNSISLKILCRKEFKGSVFVYLSVLAFSDLCSCILLFISGLSSGVLYWNDWPIYDVLLGLPLSGIFNNLSVLTIVMVTLDRLLFLRKPLVCCKPKFCHSRVARRVIVCCCLIAVTFNIPNCFLFEVTEDGQLITRDFYYSRFQFTLIWIKFFLFAVIPSIFLMIVHGFLIYYLRNLKKLSAKSPETSKCLKRKGSYSNLVTVLVLTVLFFAMSQIPAVITNRSSSKAFLFQSSHAEDPHNSKNLEIIREVATVLYALNLAADFILYYLFCPGFCNSFCIYLREKCEKKRTLSQLNVFVIGNQCDEKEQCNQRIEAIVDKSSDISKKCQKIIKNSGSDIRITITSIRNEIELQKD